MLSFVLQRRDTREVDQIITLYTAERGKIDVLARGIKKSVAKNAAALEGPAMVEAEVANGKEFPVLTTATIVQPFFNLRKSYEGLAATTTLLHIVNELTPKGEPDQKLFTAIYKIFVWLSESTSIEAVQVDRSILEVLTVIGFKPELERCVVCGAPVDGTNLGVFSVAKGGVVCGNHKEEVGVVMTESIHRLFLANNTDKNGVGLSKKEAFDFHRMVYAFLVYHTAKQLPDWQKTALD